MQHQAEILPFNTIEGYFGPAVIVEDEIQGQQVKLRWAKEGSHYYTTATVAVSRNGLLANAMNVLVAGSDENNMFIIGILDNEASATKVETNLETKVETSCGAYALLNKTNSEESLSVYSENKTLLFEYNPVTQTSKVNVPLGDLEINADQGSIVLNAGKKIEVSGDALCFTSKSLSIKSMMSEFVFGRLETSMETLIENAKNVYRSAKELTQLRTGRSRTFVDETYQLNADKVLLKSENDVKVKAEKIHLG